MNQKTHTLRIKGKYFDYLVRGSKRVEVRVGYAMIKKINVGDIIIFENHENVSFEVTDIVVFESFKELFETIPVEKIFPDYNNKEAAVKTMCKLYSYDKERLGVYAIFVKVYQPPIKLYRASKLIKGDNRKLLSTLISECYKATDFIVPDYPRHFEWYYTQQVPGIFDGTREIFAAVCQQKVVGVLFAKNDGIERKVCTIWISESMRGKHLATQLLEVSFNYLGTTKPLITIADYKMDMFKGVAAKYDWKITQTLEGYYNKTTEIVFNGTLK